MRSRSFKKLGGVLLVCALAQFCLGQGSPAPSPGELARRVDRHYDQLHSLKAGFTESYAGLGVHRVESGMLFLRKPGRMMWEYSSPSGKIFLLDGKYAWFYTKGDAQVQRIPENELDDLRSPLRFLLGHAKLQKELTGLTVAAAANGLFSLTGQPKGMEKRLTRLALMVSADGTINSIEVEEADGAITRFTFTGEQPNATIPDETLRFKPPPGVPVIDAMPPV